MDIIKRYNGKLVALVKRSISAQDNFSIITVFHETNQLMCGLFYVKLEKDQFTDTIHLTLKPTYRYRNDFYEFTKDILYHDNDLVIFEKSNQKFFTQNEINKANGFVDFINKMISYKYQVESNPNKFYINYYNSKIQFKDNNWYFNENIISENKLIEYFFKADWEYNYEKFTIKKYNIFKRFFSVFRKNNNILTNKI